MLKLESNGGGPQFKSIPGLKVHSILDRFSFPSASRVDPRPLSKRSHLFLGDQENTTCLARVYLKSCPQNQQNISAQVNRRISLHKVLTTEILQLKI